MGSVKNFSDQLLNIWRGSTPAARIGLAMLVLLCAGLVGGVGYWSMQPYYVLLADDLDATEMNKLVTELDRANISHEVRGAGNILMVDKKSWSQARLLAGNSGVETGSSPDHKLLGPWDNPLNQPANEQWNREQTLQFAISKFKSVEQVVVHLNMPRRHGFLRSEDEPTASVLLTMKRNQRLTEREANAIVQIVSKAVDRMKPQSVTVSDTDGNVFNSPDESLAVVGRQDEYRAMRELELSRAAQMILAQVYGHENVVVKVAADFSFPDKEITTRMIDPKQKVAISETILNSTTTGEGGAATGNPGTDPNVGDQANPTGNMLTTKKEDLTNTYEIGGTFEFQRHHSPVLNLLTVSVIANSTKAADASGVVPDEEKTRIENLVKTAIAFQEDRDSITVDFFPFAENGVEEVVPVSAIPWDQINEILKNASLAMGAIVALVVAWLLIGRIKPQPGNSGTGAIAADGVNRLQDLGKLVDENPEVFARIVAAWASSTAGNRDDSVTNDTVASSKRAA